MRKERDNLRHWKRQKNNRENPTRQNEMKKNKNGHFKWKTNWIEQLRGYP